MIRAGQYIISPILQQVALRQFYREGNIKQPCQSTATEKGIQRRRSQTIPRGDSQQELPVNLLNAKLQSTVGEILKD